MGTLYVFLSRRPQTRLAIVRLVLYIVFTLAAKAAFDIDTLYLLGAALLGVGDIAATGVGNTLTTPINSPKLGAGREMPPALRAAALAVQTLLPGPIGELFEVHGVEGLWALVRTAENVIKTQQSGEQLKAGRDKELQNRARQ